ncbi:MAG: VCBS repeat-containing protein [Planctomycetota bacterium]
MLVLVPALALASSASLSLAAPQQGIHPARHRPGPISTDGPAPPADGGLIGQFPGWPIKLTNDTPYRPRRGVVFVDLDSDGPLEIVFSNSDGLLHAWNHDTTPEAGFPVDLGGFTPSAPSVGDVDSDGMPEIVQFVETTSGGGEVWILEQDGTSAPGFPLAFPGVVDTGAPTLSDLDDDGVLELLVPERTATGGQLHVIEPEGSAWSGAWPVPLDAAPTGSPSVGDLDADGTPEILFQSELSLYVWDTAGAVLPGWPQDLGNFLRGSPSMADIDHDGDLEIAVSSDAGAWLLHHDGTVLPNWPRPYGAQSQCPPVLIDLEGDGSYEILAGRSGWSPLFWCWIPAGWEKFAYSDIQGGGVQLITSADIDGDGFPEIFTDHSVKAAGQGYIAGVDRFGNTLPGFPLRPSGWTYENGAHLADVDGDGDVDLGTVTFDDNEILVYLYDLPGPWTPGSTPWPTYQVSQERGGLEGSTEALHLQGTTSLGSTLQVTVAGDAGDDALVAVAFGTGLTLLPGYGWLGLAPSPAPIVLFTGEIGAAGQASFSLPVPPEPAAAGASFFLQGLTSPDLALGGSLSNVIGKTILP